MKSAPTKRADMIVHEQEPDIAFDAPDVAPEADPPQPYGGSIPVDEATAPEVLLACDSTAAVKPEHAATVGNPEGYIDDSWPSVTVTAS